MPRLSPKTKSIDSEPIPLEPISPLEALLDNWITKRGDYFVTAFLDSTVMWEEKIDIESVPFIQYLVTSLKLDKFYKTKELIRIKAFAFARNTLHSIDVNTLEYHLRISDGTDSFTDGKKIVISGKVLELKESKYEDLSGYDVFIGLALHEGCHILYTDFKEYSEFLASKDLPKGASALLHTIVNILEDERIERKLLDKYPGHGNFLARLKEYYFGGIRKKDELSEEENVTEFLNLFLQIIRYPKYLDSLLVERYIDLLFSIKEILLPYPEEMGECLDKSYEVFELILEYFDLRFEREEDDEELAKASDEISKAGGGGVSKIAVSSSEDSSDTGGSMPSKGKEESILDGEYSFSEEGLKVLADNSTKEKYNEILDRLRKYLPGFRHFLFYNTYVKHRNLVGLKSGNLDTNKLVEGFQGVQSIYARKEKPVLKRLTVSLLVDMSGSMGGDCIKRARECAVLLTEVFSTNKMVDLYVYGYTGQDITSHKAELYEYYTPKNPRKYSLVNMVAKSQNLDGFSLLQMRNEIRKDTNNDVLTFMISDGEPYATGYSGRAAIDHLKGAVTELEKDKFKIIHIAVGYSGLPDVYKNLVLVEDVATLANDLYILVKRTIK
jgi:hypothetical protein